MGNFSRDIERYKTKGWGARDLWLDPAVWSIACYRLGNWLNVSRPFLLIRLPLKVVSFLANKFCEVVMEMQISSRATIGEGLFIGHIGGVVIHPEAVIGRNCDIEEVYIGTGATLVGRIKVGSHAKIAANTLVIDDVPDGATVMGVPGRVILWPSKTAPPAE